MVRELPPHVTGSGFISVGYFDREIRSDTKDFLQIYLFFVTFPTKKIIKDKCKLSSPKLRLKISKKTFKDDDL